MNNSTPSRTTLRYRLLIYGLALLLSGFYYLGFIPKLFSNDAVKPLPHRVSLQEKPPFKINPEQLQELSFWGPLTTSQDNEELRIQLIASRLSNGYVRGEVSLLKAGELETAPGRLKSAREIGIYLEARQKLSKRRILEVFSFPFEFWREDYEHSNRQVKQQEAEVQVPSPGSYYILVESSGDQSIDSAQDFQIGVASGAGKLFSAGIAVFIFFALSLYNLIYLISSSIPEKSNV